MKLCDLQKKDVISDQTGTKLGRVYDLEFDDLSGKIEKLIISPILNFKNLFQKNELIIINFDQIETICENAILVRA